VTLASHSHPSIAHALDCGAVAGERCCVGTGPVSPGASGGPAAALRTGGVTRKLQACEKNGGIAAVMREERVGDGKNRTSGWSAIDVVAPNFGGKE
jgi:hypothetical protein